MKIGIIAWGAMADVLYATPIVAHIRQLHPNDDDHITWLVRDKFQSVVETNTDINAVKVFKLPSGYATRQDAEYAMDQQICEFAENAYDKVYDLQYWPRWSNFYDRPDEDFISLRARNAGLDSTAIVDRNIMCRPIMEDIDAAIEFYEENIYTRDIYTNVITINHISYAANPVWSFEQYCQLQDKLFNDHGIQCIFTGAPDEPIPDGCIDARGLPYRVWCEVIEMSDLWLGLDSGAKTLAAATDTPMIVMHSPDFPLGKTGCKAMGIRMDDILELTQPPTVDSLAGHIVRMMKQ